MICGNCGNNIPDNISFCPVCGSRVAAQETPAQNEIPTAETPAYRAANSDAAPDKKKPVRQKKERPPKPQSDTTLRQYITPSIGTALISAFLCAELLPYLLRSVLMLATKAPLAAPISNLCAIAGYAAAFGLLTLFSKLIGGRSPLSGALLFTSIFGAFRALSPFVLSLGDDGVTSKTVVVYIIYALLHVIAAIALTVPLPSLFVNDEQKHGGRFTAAICALLGIISADILQNVFFCLPFQRTPSFLGSASGFLLISALEAAFFTLGAKVIVKRSRSKPAKAPARKVTLITGGAAAAVAVVFLFVGVGPQNVLVTARNDVVTALVDADYILASGDMNTALYCFKLTGEHAEAWSTLANGDSYSVPDEYSDDKALLYLTFLNNSDRMEHYMVTDFDPEDIGMFGPLMLDHYSKAEQLSEDQKAHRSEVIELCIGSGAFVNEYPTMDMIEKNKDELIRLSEAEDSYSKYMRIAEIFAGVQKGETGSGSAINSFLDMAEEYPDDFRIQAIASIIGSENKSDNAGHYKRTSEAILRFLRCAEEQPELIAGSENITAVKTTAAGMLINIKEYETAESILNDVLSADPNSRAAKQHLALCYMELGQTDKSRKLAEEMIKDCPDDVTALWTLFKCAISGGDTEEAIDAASKIADAVKDGVLDGDSLLFNCVSTLSMNDSTAGFTHKVYSEDTADEPVKQIKSNDFLDQYCAAVYYEKEMRSYDIALTHVDKALGYQPQSSRLWYLKGLIYYNMEDFKNSEQALLKADALDPNDLSIMYALANTYDGMEEYAKAYDYCERCIAKYPNGADHDEDVFGAMPHAAGLAGRLEKYVKGDN